MINIYIDKKIRNDILPLVGNESDRVPDFNSHMDSNFQCTIPNFDSGNKWCMLLESLLPFETQEPAISNQRAG